MNCLMPNMASVEQRLGVVLLFVAFGFYLIKKSKKYRR